MKAVIFDKFRIEEQESVIDVTIDDISLGVLSTTPVEARVSPSIRSMQKIDVLLR